jgi:hypothetical protein
MTLEKQIATTTDALIRLERRKAIKEYAAKEQARKDKRNSDNDARKADAHRKITLGGLVIAAGVDQWNEAEIVGALLYMADKFAALPDGIPALRERGIQHLAEREATRKTR